MSTRKKEEAPAPPEQTLPPPAARMTASYDEHPAVCARYAKAFTSALAGVCVNPLAFERDPAWLAERAAQIAAAAVDRHLDVYGPDNSVVIGMVPPGDLVV